MPKARGLIASETRSADAWAADPLDAAGYAREPLDGAAPVRQVGPSHVLARPAG